MVGCMKISVVIPVYNAEKYVSRAVESALDQKECGEVILVEDGSPDNALQVCTELAERYPNVSLYQHENNQNKGAGPSRNLGVRKARFDYIAFLDADDFFGPMRFASASKLLLNDNALDGVYEPVGSCFENEAAKQRFFATHADEIAMVKKGVMPEELFESLISGRNGYIHLDGLLIKKKAFFKAGMIPALKLHQDMVFIFKLSLVCKLAHGRIEKPVSFRVLHANNRITKPGTNYLQSYHAAYQDLLTWMKGEGIGGNRRKLVATRYHLLNYRFCWRNKRYLSAFASYLRHKILVKTTMSGVNHGCWRKLLKIQKERDI